MQSRGDPDLVVNLIICIHGPYTKRNFICLQYTYINLLIYNCRSTVLKVPLRLIQMINREEVNSVDDKCTKRHYLNVLC